MKTGRQNKKAFEVDALVKTIAEEILSEAASLRATDIHIEPRENHTLVRLRVGGLLQTAKKLPIELSAKLAKYFKFLANLNFSEKTFTQIGHFSRDDYRARVSTSPVFLGEKTTIRLIRNTNNIRKLDQIGLWGDNLKSVKKALSQPRGVIITFGDGRTSTNFAMIDHLNSDEKSIVTIERQIEKTLSGVNQIATNPKIGLDHAACLRAALAQNPDIILIDQVRDKATADLIFEASMAGKLVIASIPVQKSSQVVPFLQFLGIKNYISSTNIIAIIGQTLVRSTSEENLIFEKINAAESQAILNQLRLPANIFHNLEKSARAEFSPKTHTNTTDGAISKIAKFNGEKEIFTGSIALFEVINLLESGLGANFQNFIITQPTVGEIEDFLRENNFVSIKADGVVKSLCGQTTFKEIIRRTGF